MILSLCNYSHSLWMTFDIYKMSWIDSYEDSERIKLDNAEKVPLTDQ